MIGAKAIIIPEGAVARILVGDDVIWKTKKIITTDEMLVKNTGAERFESLNLTPNSHNGEKNTAYFTFKHIPIEPNATYYSKFGTRSWLLDGDKNTIKTLNLSTKSGTGSDVQYQFVAPNNACYISIAYSYASAGSGDDVYIRKVE